MAAEQGTTGSGLSDDEIAKLRAIAAERVVDFPPLSREQAELVRSILQLKPKPATGAADSEAGSETT